MDALLRPSGGLLLRPCGGLLGRYLISGEGGLEIPVHERVDARLDFPVPQRLDAAYIFHWDMKRLGLPVSMPPYSIHWRSEEHTSELQSQSNLVCRLLLEKKKNKPDE